MLCVYHDRETTGPSYTLDLLWGWVRQMASALEAMASIPMRHGDVAARNIMLQGDKLVLADLGLARVVTPRGLGPGVNFARGGVDVAPEGQLGSAVMLTVSCCKLDM